MGSTVTSTRKARSLVADAARDRALPRFFHLVQAAAQRDAQLIVGHAEDVGFDAPFRRSQELRHVSEAMNDIQLLVDQHARLQVLFQQGIIVVKDPALPAYRSRRHRPAVAELGERPVPLTAGDEIRRRLLPEPGSPPTGTLRARTGPWRGRNVPGFGEEPPQMASTPSAPSLPVPIRITPTARAPTSPAREAKNTSIGSSTRRRWATRVSSR